MRRREFLQQAGLSLGALTAAAWAEPEAGTEKAPVREGAAEAARPGDWAWVREQFPLTRTYAHFATFLLAAHPRPVAEAIAQHRAALDANPVDYWHEHAGRADERVRAAAAEYMGAKPEQIALTDSTTMGLGLVYGSLRLAAGEEFVSTTHDHYSTQMALRHRAERTGAAVREVALYDDPAQASVEEIVARTTAAIGERTRVLAVTWVHSSTGVKLPLAAMAAALRRINDSRVPAERVLFCVDGVHGFGIEDVTMEGLGCDFFVAGTHKWIFGPRGTGVVWGRAEAWERAAAIIPSFGANYGVWLGEISREQVVPGDLMTPGGFHSFEHRWALGEAFRFHLQLGKARVQARIHALNTLAKEAMAAMPHIRVHTPRSEELSAGIICFEAAGRSGEEVLARLREHGIVASTSPYRVSYPRLAPSLLNNEAEVERAMEALRSLA